MLLSGACTAAKGAKGVQCLGLYARQPGVLELRGLAPYADAQHAMSPKPTAEEVTEGIDLAGQRFLITGASSGLGLELARVLALRGASLVLPVRSLDKGRRVLDSAGLDDEARGRCELVVCDLSRLEAVRALVGSLVQQGRSFQGLALNAGVFGLPFELTPEGLEFTFASNFAGHFVLLHGLLQHRLLVPTGRVLATLSEAVRLNPFLRPDVRLLTEPRAHAKRFGAASSPTAKVLLSLSLLHLARAVRGTWAEPMEFFGVDPGATLTDNINQGGRVAQALMRVLGPRLLKPVGQGAAVLAWALTTPSLPGGRGLRYFTNELAPVPIPRRWLDADLAEQVWRASEAHLATGPLRL
jgi:NAD(P)-dependent dehydrogenase (short-subunit alcohol dehydrogenase family)